MSSASVPRTRSTLFRYLVPVVGLSLATGLSVLIRHTVGMHPAITISFLVAVMASSWWGGYIPGLIACMLGMFAVPFAFNSHFDPTTASPSRTVLVLLVSLLISWVAERRNLAEANLRDVNETLDEKVRQRTYELERSNAELRRLNEDLNQFAYSASHDLREPLRMIMIFSQLVQRKHKGQLDAEANGYLATVVESAKRMETLLQDLLAYAHTINITAEKVGIVDSDSIVAQALTDLSAAVNESGAQITCTGLPRLRMQEVHLRQLIENLVGNAIKYRREEPPRVEISAEPHASGWKICVKDHGIGMAPQYTEQIFRMFKRLHTVAEYEGTGMGLAICQRIVERYGGTIWVEQTEEGKGSTFCFTLPRAIEQTKAAKV